MGKVYRDRDEIPIPDEAYVNTYDGRVYVKRGDERRIVIGHAASGATMSPNDTFRALFPKAWEAAYGQDEPARLEVDVGIYTLALGAGLTSGAYPVVQAIYGLDTGNALMDYAMFSALGRAGTARPIEDELADEVTFCPTVKSDAWYQETFEALTEDEHRSYRTAWLKRCHERGVERVWLNVEDTHGECRVMSEDHNGSRATAACIEAINATDGRPVTYFAAPDGIGGTALQEAVSLLSTYGIEVAGVIAGRDLCTPEVVRTLRDLSMEFVVALPTDAVGYEEAYADLAESVCWNTEHLVDEDGVFGAMREGRIWGDAPESAFVGLYFDGPGAALRSDELIRMVCGALREAGASLAAGRQPTVESELEHYLRLERDEAGCVTSAALDHEALDEALSELGFFSLACSADMGAKAAYDAYRLRDAARAVRSPMKTQEDAGDARVRSDASMRSCLAADFLARLLRFEVRNACEALGLDTDHMVRKISRMHLVLSGPDVWTPTGKHTSDELALLASLGVRSDGLMGIAEAYGQRLLDPSCGQTHRLPEQKPLPRRGRGRQKGSKNKKTLEREAEIALQKAAGTYVEPTKRKPGRPKGSKDTKPRKQRSDAGVKRGPRKKAPEADAVTESET